MAASSFLLIGAVALLISPALSLTCKSQILSQQNTTFANCTSLQALNAILHWTYTPATNPTLSIAFTATPASSNGWVAWALNPTGSGMLGAQSLIAFKENGSLVVKMYNISTYSGISESKISYDVLNKSAEYYSGGNITIYATFALPKAAAEVNQVWQVGAEVTNGVPAKHASDKANLNSKSTLKLVSGVAETPAETPAQSPESAAAPGPSGGRQSGSVNGGGARVWGSGLGLYGVLVLLWVSYFGF